jgi:hypothetical protein
MNDALFEKSTGDHLVENGYAQVRSLQAAINACHPDDHQERERLRADLREARKELDFRIDMNQPR